MNGSPTSLAESFFETLFHRDAGGRSWLPRLLAAAPRGRQALGRLVEDPGTLVTTLAVRGPGGRLGAFEALDPPVREILDWYVENPDALARPAGGGGVTPEAARLQRALLDDDPPGARARAQERARELLVMRSPLTTGWWRFEDVGRLDLLLQSHRLVLTVLTRGGEALGSVTEWYPPRTPLVRALETARLTSQGVAWGTLLLAAEERPELDGEGLTRVIERGTPHLSAESRAELEHHFLGALTWEQAREAVGIAGSGGRT